MKHEERIIKLLCLLSRDHIMGITKLLMKLLYVQMLLTLTKIQ